jgi:predicted Rossmann fold flavoprotein
MKPKHVIVIGGGAAGLVAAIAARRQGANVTILEKNPRVGKKLLATGNGRCNFTNMDLDLSHWHGNEPRFARGALTRFDGARTLEFFQELGIVPRQEEAGKVFPASGQAGSVLDVLRHEVETSGVSVITEAEVRALENTGRSFAVRTGESTFSADAVVIATGGRAGPQFGCTGAGYDLAASFGHRLVKPFPALVQLRLNAPFLRALAGVKFVGTATILAGQKPLRRAEGEILFTDYGISGPPIFDLSRTAGEVLARGEQPTLRLSILPDQSQAEVRAFLDQRFQTQGAKEADFSLVGFLNKRLIPVLLKEAGLNNIHQQAAQVGNQVRTALARLLTAWDFTVTGTNGWSAAQVTAGGLDVRDLDPYTMASRLVPGLYFAGEVIDIDGDCGGYNLQWAWSSGYVAGTSAAQAH